MTTSTTKRASGALLGVQPQRPSDTGEQQLLVDAARLRTAVDADRAVAGRSGRVPAAS